MLPEPFQVLPIVGTEGLSTAESQIFHQHCAPWQDLPAPTRDAASSKDIGASLGMPHKGSFTSFLLSIAGALLRSQLGILIWCEFAIIKFASSLPFSTGIHWVPEHHLNTWDLDEQQLHLGMSAEHHPLLSTILVKTTGSSFCWCCHILLWQNLTLKSTLFSNLRPSSSWRT